MTVKPLSDPRLFYVTYTDYNSKNLVIKGTVINDLKNPPHFFEVIEGDEIRQIVEDEMGAGAADTGFVVRVMMANNEITAIGFMIEVSQFLEA
jgi:hypothetical protein